MITPSFSVKMPSELADWIKAHVSSMSTTLLPQTGSLPSLNILEYGTGGSSFLFTENPLNFLVACETSSQWLDKLKMGLKAHGRRNFLPVHMNIGPTVDWGMPLCIESQNHLFQEAVKMPSKICRGISFVPDFVLIDGRFRVACFLEALSLCQPGCLILFDDYAERPEYHVVEKLVPVFKMVGRAALFRPCQNFPLARDLLSSLEVYYLCPD